MSLDSFSGPDFVGGLIDHFVVFLEERPDFRAIAFGGHISSTTRAAHSLPDSAGMQKSLGIGYEIEDGSRNRREAD
jgi:hypothetical protein